MTDSSSGLSYQLLSSPWRRGCPAALNMPMLSWSAGENAMAGHVIINGSAFDWHGNVPARASCSSNPSTRVPPTSNRPRRAW